MNKLEAYKQILAVINSCVASCAESYIELDRKADIRVELGCLIEKEELSDEFGIDMSDTCLSYNKFYNIDDFQKVMFFGDKYKRTISWSDDGSQPDNEWLYCISFPTGAYIFGKDYPTKTFQAFFNELKEFEPKYADTSNKYLYFTSDKSAEVYKNFYKIFNRYKGLVEKELKEKRKAELQRELDKLKDD